MADGKKKRSLREAFGVVRPAEETTASEAPKDGTPGAAAGPVGAPDGGKPASGNKEKPEGPAPRRRRAGSNRNGSNGETRARKGSAKAASTGDPANTASRSGAGAKGRGRAAAGDEGSDE